MAEGDTGSSRNFRSAYYEKLGFCGNEEKNILDLLIASSPFDLEKLGDLCERFDLDRHCVEAWKVLLGVDCGKKNPFDEFANVRRVRTEHFQSLKHHLEVLLRHNAVIKDRLKKCSKSDRSRPFDDHKHSQNENCNLQSQNNEQKIRVFIGEENTDVTNQPSCTVIPTRENGDVNHTLENAGAFSNSKRNQNNSQNSVLENIEVSVLDYKQVASNVLFNQLIMKNPFMTTKKNPGRQITLMYLLEAGRLDSSDIDTQLDSYYCRKLSAMASFFANVSNDPQEAFFIFRNFTRKLEENEALEKSQANTNNKV